MNKKLALFCLANVIVLSACQKENTQVWTVPGMKREGQQAYEIRKPDPNTKYVEKLIYKIDDQRFFTMFAREGICEFGGEIWYYDTKRNIHVDTGNTDFFRWGFRIDSEQYLALPVDSGEGSAWGAIYYSKDYGKTWQGMPRYAGGYNSTSFLDGTFIKYESEIDRDGNLKANAKNISMFYINLSKPFNIPYSEKTKNNMENGFLIYYIETKKTITTRQVNHSSVDVPLEFDSSFLTKVKTPSGWTKFRCEDFQSKGAQ